MGSLMAEQTNLDSELPFTSQTEQDRLEDNSSDSDTLALASRCLSTMQVQLSRIVTKPTKWHVRPAKTQISLGIRPV